MQLRAIFNARGVLRVIVGLTAAYVLAIALFVYTSDRDPSFKAEALFFLKPYLAPR